MQHPEDAPFSSLSRMGAILADFERDRFVITQGWWSRARSAARTAQSIGMKPVTLFGTALAYLNMCSKKLRTSPRIASGQHGDGNGRIQRERTRDCKRRSVRQLSLRLGIPIDSIWNEYGMTELSSQFYSHGVGRSHRAPPWMRFQIIDPETNEEASPGKVGSCGLSTLANLWSVLAVLTQDLAIAQPDGGFLLLGRDPSALPRGCSRAMDELILDARG